MINKAEINKYLKDLYPLNRSLTGKGNLDTLNYINDKILKSGKIKSIKSGTKVFDWSIPPEWSIKNAYVKNKYGKKIIDIKENNLHLISYSKSFKGILSKKQLLNKLFFLKDKPDSIPYRTTYYKKDWGFCCTYNLIKSKDFKEPFNVKIDSKLNNKGQLIWLEALKKGKSKKEILISTYMCHPSLANDNLSGLVLASILFKIINKKKTYYSYRLIIIPETIGSITFLSRSKIKNIIGGMVITCTAGPDKLSLKEGFNSSHWINKAAHMALNNITDNNYITYPFTPDGSDERQYSSPKFRIVTPSIHKSKYYEYKEYHTSKDNLNFISSKYLKETLNAYLIWINYIESYCFPNRISKECEFQLGKRNLYPNTGGTINQKAHHENRFGFDNRKFNLDDLKITGKHLDAFNWLMHLADGKNSNFKIADKSNINIDIINESIQIFKKNKLIKIKR